MKGLFLTMTNKDLKTRVLRFSSKALQHEPEYLKMELGKDGWVSIKKLLEKFEKKGLIVDKRIFCDIIKEDKERGLEISGDKNRVRFNPDRL